MKLEDLPQPLPDVSQITLEIEVAVQKIHGYYTARQFAVLPPTSLEDIGTDSETMYMMVGEHVWKNFFGDDAVEPQEALPAQLHSVIAHQAKQGALRFAKGKGKGKGKDNNQY